MRLQLTTEMANEISRAVLMEKTASEIADLVDFRLMDKKGDDTYANHIALRHFIGESMRNPKGYLHIDGVSLRNMVESEAESIDRKPLGTIITAEFWAWSDFIGYDLIAEVVNVVADSTIRFGTKRRRRFR